MNEPLPSDQTCAEAMCIVGRLVAWDRTWPKYSDHSGISEREMDALCRDAGALIERVTTSQPSGAI